MNMQEAVNTILSAGYNKDPDLRTQLEQDIAAFVNCAAPDGVSEWMIYQVVLGEEPPRLDMRPDGWHIHRIGKMPSRLKSRIKMRALKLLRRANRQD